jgi:hypothetical protein
VPPGMLSALPAAALGGGAPPFRPSSPYMSYIWGWAVRIEVKGDSSASQWRHGQHQCTAVYLAYTSQQLCQRQHQYCRGYDSHRTTIMPILWAVVDMRQQLLQRQRQCFKGGSSGKQGQWSEHTVHVPAVLTSLLSLSLSTSYASLISLNFSSAASLRRGPGGGG